MNALYRLLRPILFLLDPELAHQLAVAFLKLWSWVAGTPHRIAPRFEEADKKRLQQRILGMDFAHPLGLAAGLDKGSVFAPACFRLGFSFVEIGSITPRPQAGNPKPRMFRIVEARALINRMGFNNEGRDAVAARLAALPRQPGPLGINLGRNKDTPNERAAEDYVLGFRALARFADYVAINVSSPNTPGLRSLQEAGELSSLIRAVARARDDLASSVGERRLPLFVKLSPDEPDERLDAIARAAVAAGADGIIATNTTLSRQGVERSTVAKEAGGLSGEPLRARALAACARIYRATEGMVPIIGVGGIATAEDAYARIRAGASLLQIYSALVIEGPGVAEAIARGLARLLARDDLTMERAVGLDARASTPAANMPAPAAQV